MTYGRTLTGVCWHIAATSATAVCGVSLLTLRDFPGAPDHLCSVCWRRSLLRPRPVLTPA